MVAARLSKAVGYCNALGLTFLWHGNHTANLLNGNSLQAEAWTYFR
jgi:hypothetical protein